MRIGTVPANTANYRITTQHLPETLVLVPQGVATLANITLLQVSVAGEKVVCNLDATGIAWLNQLTNTRFISTSLELQLATGLVTGKTVDFTISNSHATAAIDVYSINTRKSAPLLYVVSQPITLLASQFTNLAKFSAVMFPSMAAGDYLTVEYEDGTTQQLYRDELNVMLAQENSNTTATYGLLNFDARIKNVSYFAIAQQLAYMSYLDNVVIS